MSLEILLYKVNQYSQQVEECKKRADEAETKAAEAEKKQIDLANEIKSVREMVPNYIKQINETSSINNKLVETNKQHEALLIKLQNDYALQCQQYKEIAEQNKKQAEFFKQRECDFKIIDYKVRKWKQKYFDFQVKEGIMCTGGLAAGVATGPGIFVYLGVMVFRFSSLVKSDNRYAGKVKLWVGAQESLTKNSGHLLLENFRKIADRSHKYHRDFIKN